MFLKHDQNTDEFYLILLPLFSSDRIFSFIEERNLIAVIDRLKSTKQQQRTSSGDGNKSHAILTTTRSPGIHLIKRQCGQSAPQGIPQTGEKLVDYRESITFPSAPTTNLDFPR